VRKDITVAADERTLRGKNEARRLRVKGFVPAVVYGGEAGPDAVSVNPKDLNKILNSKTGHNTIFNLSIAGKQQVPVMVVDWQHDPVKENLLHVDLKRIDLTKRIAVKVPVVTHGDPKGVKLQGGLHEIITREVEIECLPDDIPEEFVVNVAELMMGQSVRAGDIQLSANVKLLSPAEAVISHVVSVKAEEVAPAAEVVATGAAEPEVIKKGKKDEEGGEAAAAPPAKKK
jgi:large subunit ribosomal protein L25